MPIKRPRKRGDNEEHEQMGITLNNQGEPLFDESKMKSGNWGNFRKRGFNATRLTKEQVEERIKSNGKKRSGKNTRIGAPHDTHYSEMVNGGYPMNYKGFKIYCYDKQAGRFNGGPTQPTYIGSVNIRNKPNTLTNKEIRAQSRSMLPYAKQMLEQWKNALQVSDQDIQAFLDRETKQLKGFPLIDQRHIDEIKKERGITYAIAGFKTFCKRKIRKWQNSVKTFSK